MTPDELFHSFETPAQIDLKLNFKKFYEESALPKKEASLVGLSCAEALNCKALSDFFKKNLTQLGASSEEVTEAKDMAALMGVANSYYRFRHMMETNEAYQRPAGFRMRLMNQAKTEKKVLEMMAVAISVISGCEFCVKGHEKSLRELGVSEDQIHDIARFASTLKGLEVYLR